MGYTTDFYGKFEFDKPVTKEIRDYVNMFSNTRRMRRDNNKIKEIFPNWQELCFNGELGIDGEYFVGGKGSFGQDKDESIINYNEPASNHPGLWCQWRITNDCKYLEWDGGEKFYNYIEWLDYLISNFLQDYKLNGKVNYQGESYGDRGTIVVVDNNIYWE